MSSATQNQYIPEIVSLPGETLLEVLEERDLTQAELADRTGRPKKTINEIVKGKTAITSETALQLERALGVSAAFWNNLERNYQDYLARRQEQEKLEAHTDWLRELPVREMINRDWIAEKKDKVDQVRELLGFFGVATPEQWRCVFERPQVSFRKATAFESHAGALAAWLRKGELKAQHIPCAAFDKANFRTALEEARRLTIEPPEVFQDRLVQLCAQSGVAVVFVPQLRRSRASGATRWLAPSKALIQLSLRYRCDDQLWFSFFHEAAHILLHGKKTVFLEKIDAEDSQREEEEANDFAANLLIPADQLEKLRPWARRRRISAALVQSFADEVGVAPGIVVGRLQHMGWLPYSHLNKLKRGLEWADEAS